MRTLLLIFALSLALQPTFAATTITSEAPHHNKLYEKGKGTVGLVCGLVLGPVGLLGVHICSHNLTQRKKAEKGAIIWAEVVLTTAFIVLIVFAAKSGKSSGSDWKIGHLGSNSGSADVPGSHRKGPEAPHYHPALEAIPTPYRNDFAPKTIQPS